MHFFHQKLAKYTLDSCRGFTLIELLISVALVGILATIAYPSYLENVKKAKRSEAQAALISLASELEVLKLANNGFYYIDPDKPPTAKSILSDQVPIDGGKKTYDLEVSFSSNRISYSLKAISVSGDDRCDPLTYDNLGQKNAGALDCW